MGPQGPGPPPVTAFLAVLARRRKGWTDRWEATRSGRSPAGQSSKKLKSRQAVEAAFSHRLCGVAGRSPDAEALRLSAEPGQGEDGGQRWVLPFLCGGS